MRRIACVWVVSCFALAAAAGEAPDASRPAETAAVDALPGLKIYADQLDPDVFTRVNYGYDRDEVCNNGLCDNGTTACTTNTACNGIGSGLCNYTACNTDFAVCDDGKPCGNNSHCAGIGSGTCHANPCDPPNNVCGVEVSYLTPGAPAGQTIWQLVCDPDGGGACQADFWDFSQNTLGNHPAMVKSASTTTPIDSTETPSWNQCGFNEPGSLLDRQDKNWTGLYTIRTLNSIERENDIKVCMNATNNGAICSSDANCSGGGTCVTTSTIWLRAAVRYEGVPSAGLGDGESRICHVGGGRTPVPLWRFPNADAQGQYMQLGDPRWEHTAFNCQNTILYPASVNSYACSGFEGKQTGQVVNEGVVKLPSGHQFEALVVRSKAEYCVGLTGLCFGVDDVRTVLHLWEVPHLGTVVRLQSDKTAPNDTNFTHLAEIDVKYGLFPPLSLTTGTVTDTSVELAWDPGLITDEIDGYRIYWDTESGGRCDVGGEDCNADAPLAGENCPAGKTCCATLGDTCDGYDFDSDTDAGQVSFDTATSATVSGLDPTRRTTSRSRRNRPSPIRRAASPPTTRARCIPRRSRPCRSTCRWRSRPRPAVLAHRRSRSAA